MIFIQEKTSTQQESSLNKKPDGDTSWFCASLTVSQLFPVPTAGPRGGPEAPLLCAAGAAQSGEGNGQLHTIPLWTYTPTMGTVAGAWKPHFDKFDHFQKGEVAHNCISGLHLPQTFTSNLVSISETKPWTSIPKTHTKLLSGLTS